MYCTDCHTVWPKTSSIVTLNYTCFDSKSCIQVGAFGDPGRDPRGWQISAAYAALVPSTEMGVKAAVGVTLW